MIKVLFQDKFGIDMFERTMQDLKSSFYVVSKGGKRIEFKYRGDYRVKDEMPIYEEVE